MSNISVEQLDDLTTRINARLDEFDIPMPNITKGIVRLVHGVIEEWWNTDVMAEQMDGKWMEVVITNTTADANMIKHVEADVKTNGNLIDLNGFAARAKSVLESEVKATEPEPTAKLAPPPLSASAAATLGPEHTVVTPLGTRREAVVAPTKKPRTLAEVEQEGERREVTELSGTGDKAAQLREVIGELQMISEKGEMPSMARWDEQKPSNLPKAQALCMRHGLNWGKLAGYAQLTPSVRTSAQAAG